MAITVHWDDGTSATWDTATDYERASTDARAPYLIMKDDVELTLVPDFGVRYVGRAPDKVKTPAHLQT